MSATQTSRLATSPPRRAAAPWAPPRWLTVAAPLAALAAIVAAWQAATAVGSISRILLPAPSEIASAFATSGADLLTNAGYTAAEAVLGFLVGNVAGLVAAIAFAQSDVTRRAIFPLATAAQAVPIVAVTPALILWLGNGMAPKIFVAAFLVFFPMLVNAMRGLRSVDADVSEMLHTLSANRWQKLVIVRLPASIRFVFNAVKLSACGCVVAALVAEWVSADHGLGYLIVYWSAQYKMAEVWTAVITGTAMSMAMYGLATLAERAATPWLAVGEGLNLR